MSCKERVSKWRAKHVAEGGKPIGVTLTANAALALESLQTYFHLSQREAISFALEIAAGHPELWACMQQHTDASAAPQSGTGRPCITDIEQRLARLEAALATLQNPPPLDTSENALPSIKERLIAFTAQQMMEHGERMSRVTLYSLAQQYSVPVPPTQHEYSVFISYHMDQIREMMRKLKEKTH